MLHSERSLFLPSCVSHQGFLPESLPFLSIPTCLPGVTSIATSSVFCLPLGFSSRPSYVWLPCHVPKYFVLSPLTENLPRCPIATVQSPNSLAWWIHGSPENDAIPASIRGFLSHLVLYLSGSCQFLYPLFSSTLWFIPLSLLEWLSPFLLVEMLPFFKGLLIHSTQLLRAYCVLIVVGAGHTEVK